MAYISVLTTQFTSIVILVLCISVCPIPMLYPADGVKAFAR